jgi:FMN reductase
MTRRFRIVAIIGTSRPGNFTSKAMAIAVEEFRAHDDIELDLIDAGALNLSPPGIAGVEEDARQLKERILAADGILFSTPEYHGSMCSVAKLIIENLGFPSTLRGKPVALLGVAAGAIGAIKALEQLRSVCSHVGALVLPGSVSIAKVRDVFDSEGRCTDPASEKRLRGLADSLLDYVRRHTCPSLTSEQMVRE